MTRFFVCTRNAQFLRRQNLWHGTGRDDGNSIAPLVRTVPHAGFGLGFERTMAYVTGLANVRDAIPFPRTPGNAKY